MHLNSMSSHRLNINTGYGYVPNALCLRCIGLRCCGVVPVHPTSRMGCLSPSLRGSLHWSVPLSGRMAVPLFFGALSTSASPLSVGMSVPLTSGALSASPSPLSVGMSVPLTSGALSPGAGGAACGRGCIHNAKGKFLKPHPNLPSPCMLLHIHWVLGDECVV